MFWIFSAILVLAFGLVKLGQLSVLVTLLSAALKLTLILLAVLVAVYVWRLVTRS